MSTTTPALAARARRAYERDRIALGLRTATAAVPMAILSWIACDEPAAAVASALALAGVVTASVWRGQDVGRGARIGLLACIPSLLGPLLVVATGHVCDRSVCLLFPAACLVGGVLSGLALGWLALRTALGPAGFVTAGLAAWLGGTFGCIVMGSVGVAVLALGLATGLAPALALRRA